MNCQSIIIGTVPIVLFLGIAHYAVSVYKSNKLNKRIRETLPNVWSPYGGGNQTTEIALLAKLLVDKASLNANIVTSFGLVSLILTAVVSTIYSLSQLNPSICLPS